VRERRERGRNEKKRVRGWRVKWKEKRKKKRKIQEYSEKERGEDQK
jgi:hypothetical protein